MTIGDDDHTSTTDEDTHTDLNTLFGERSMHNNNDQLNNGQLLEKHTQHT